MNRLHVLGTVELLRDDGAAAQVVTAQPKRLALLVYLATAQPRGFHSRDELVSLFWPESSEARARGALGQALYFLRRALGSDVLIRRGQGDVAVAPDRLWCDAAALHDVLASHSIEQALDLYRGEFMPGFLQPDAPAFEEWLDRERRRLRNALREAGTARAAALEPTDPGRAAALLRRTLEIAPEDEVALRRLMRILDGAGDRAGALAAFDTCTRRLATELDVSPSPETVALRDTIVARAVPMAGGDPPLPAIANTVGPAAREGTDIRTNILPAESSAEAFRQRIRRRFRGVAVAGAAILTVLLVRELLSRRGAGRIAPEDGAFTLAVAPFTTATADTGLERIARELVVPLSANLDGLGDVRTVEGVEVLATAGAGEAADTAIALARRLGATRVLYGGIVASGDGLRAEATLRHVRGERPVLRASVLADRNVSALADSLTWAVLAEMWKDRQPATHTRGVSPPEPGPAALGTRSLPALREYWEGERAMSEARYADGAERFALAIALDSTYWFAYWRHAYARATIEAPVDDRIHAAYAAHLDRFPERDRLLIQARMAEPLSERMQRLLQVTRRFPDDWFGWWDYANRLVHDGPLLGWSYDDARNALERALALRPNDVIALQHLFWMAALDSDIRTMEHVLRRTHQLRASSPNFELARPDYLLLFEMILAAARADDAGLNVSIAENIADLIENVPGDYGDRFSTGLASFGYHPAQIRLTHRFLQSPASAQLKGAQHRALMQTWAARGAWDSAFVAARIYASTFDGAAPLQHIVRLAVTAERLGALPATATDSWREELSRYEQSLDVTHQAELAWLDGVAAAARGRPGDLAAARQRLHRLAAEPPGAGPLSWPFTAVTESGIVGMLDVSLQAFALAMDGDVLLAGETLAEIERQRVEYGWNRRMAGMHPYVTGIHRLAAAGWLREAGRPADAERLLRWIEAIEFPGYLVNEATAVLSAHAYYERALSAEALGRQTLARRYYRQFLRRYDMPIAAHRQMVDGARRAAGPD